MIGKKFVTKQDTAFWSERDVYSKNLHGKMSFLKAGTEVCVVEVCVVEVATRDACPSYLVRTTGERPLYSWLHSVDEINEVLTPVEEGSFASAAVMRAAISDIETFIKTFRSADLSLKITRFGTPGEEASYLTKMRTALEAIAVRASKENLK
jgi:hypothetical protein